MSTRTSADSSCSSWGEDFNGLPAHVQQSSTPMPFSSTLYQQQPEASRFNFHYQGLAGILPPENLSVTSSASKTAKLKHPCDLPALLVDRETSRYDVWGFSNDSPLASTLTEDDFLEMVSVAIHNDNIIHLEYAVQTYILDELVLSK